MPPPQRPKITGIKLVNFKSFVGEITVGPIGDFTVFTGANELGHCDLMDGIDFACGVYNPSAASSSLVHRDANNNGCSTNEEEEGAAAERSAAIIITTTQMEAPITFKRHAMRMGTTNAHEFEINGLAVPEATYFERMQQLHIKCRAAAPFIVNADFLVALFKADRQQLLKLCEVFCGSAQFRRECYTHSARALALRENIARHHEQLAGIHRKQLRARRQLSDCREAQLKLDTLLHMDRHLRLWQIQQATDNKDQQLVIVEQELLDLCAQINSAQRDLTLVQRDIQKVEERLNIVDEPPPATLLLPVPDEKHALQKLQLDKAVEQHFRNESALVDGILDGDSSHVADSDAFESYLRQRSDRIHKRAEHLLQTIPDDESGYERSDKAVAADIRKMRIAQNADLREHCASVTAQMARCRDAWANEMRQHAEAVAAREALRVEHWDRLLSSSEIQQLHALRAVRELGAVHVLQAIETPLSGPLLKLALHELLPAVVCDSDAHAEEVAQRLRATAAAAAAGDGGDDAAASAMQSVGVHGVQVLLTPANIDAGPRQRPSVAGARRVEEMIGGLDNCYGLERYLANRLAAVVTETDSLARECATSTMRAPQTAITTAARVMFDRRGGMSFEGCADEAAVAAAGNEQPSRMRFNALDVERYELEVPAAQADGSDASANAANNDADGLTMAEATIAEMGTELRAFWKMMLTSEVGESVDAEHIRGVHDAARAEAQQAVMAETTNYKLCKRSADHLRLSSLLDQYKSVLDQNAHAELVDLKVEKSNTKERLQKDCADLRKQMLELLIIYQGENASIDFRTGRMELLRADDATTLDAVAINYACIADLLRGPDDDDDDAIATKRVALGQMLADAAENCDRLKVSRLCTNTFDLLAADRERVDAALADAQRTLDETNAAFAVALQLRIERFRPFYEHMQRELPQCVQTLYNSSAAQTFLLPEIDGPDADASDPVESIVSAFDAGLSLSVMPPDRRFRPNVQFTDVEQVCVAIAFMFAVYAHAEQPFVFVHQLDDVMAAATTSPQQRQLLVDFLVAQCRERRMQIIVCSDRAEWLPHADVAMAVLLMDNLQSNVAMMPEE